MSVDTQQRRAARAAAKTASGKRGAATIDAPTSIASRFSRIASGVWYATLWCACWAIGAVWFRFRYTGRRHVPSTGPVLLVANHQSHLDPVLVGIAAPRQLKYLARHGLFFWPFSWWIRALGAVPIDREKGAVGGIRTTLKLLQQREAVLVFPEGSRTFTGRLQPMRPGFCLLARRTGATIVPVAIRGAFESMPRGTAYPRPRPISLAFLPSISREQYEHLNDDDLTAAVRNCIAAAR